MDIFSGANAYLHQLNAKRPIISDFLPNIFPDGGPVPRSLVEISGERNSGKTILLMQIIANCLLSCKVILINNCHKIDYQLLGKYVQESVKKGHPEALEPQLNEIFDQCMDSCDIINCFSSMDTRMALTALENHILIGNERASLVAVDGLCEFYWIDLPPTTRMRKYNYYINYVEHLNRISKKFNVCSMYTVDNSFLNASIASNSVTIDYKLKLKSLENGTRTLNDKYFVISEKGIKFI